MNKKDNYIVKCNNSEETQKVIQFVKPYLRGGISSHWNYVVSNTGEGIYWVYDSKPPRFSEYPLITFSEWEVLPNEEFILPEKWAIKITSDNLEEVGNYYNRQGSSAYTNTDNIGSYYVSHNLASAVSVMGKEKYGANFTLGKVPFGSTEITTEQFREFVLGIKTPVNEEFVLPEKWAVKGFIGGNKEIEDYANENGVTPPYSGNELFHHFPPTKQGYTTNRTLYEGYTEITYEQFKKYVLKQDNMEEIIQYRVKPEFQKVSKALYETFNRDVFEGYAHFNTKSVLKEQYEKAGVLDIWFECQTKKIFTLPEINGYKGEDKGDYLVYGCAELPVAWFTTINSSPWNRDIKSLKLSSGVKINEGEMNMIRTYLKHR